MSTDGDVIGDHPVRDWRRTARLTIRRRLQATRGLVEVVFLMLDEVDRTPRGLNRAIGMAAGHQGPRPLAVCTRNALRDLEGRVPARRPPGDGSAAFPCPTCPAHESVGCTVKAHEGSGTQEVCL